MTVTRSNTGQLAAVSEVKRWLKLAPVRAMLELAARLGYVARGLVYLSLGAVALFAAADLAPTAKGAAEAVAAWAAWPLGKVLIALIAAGLVGFAMWRGLQALFDADGHGRTPKGLAVRFGQGLSGLIHAALAVSVFSVIDGMEDASEEGGAEAIAEMLLSMPNGGALLVALGAVAFILGLANLGQGLFQNFAKRLGCEEPAQAIAVKLARFGYIGRTLAFAPLGFFLLEAGLDVRASKARSLGETLQVLEAQPFGSWILGFTGLGLVAFGLFALIEARYRRMHVPAALDVG